MKASLNPLDYLRKSPTGQKIVAEIEAGDEAAEARKAAAKTVTDLAAKVDAARDAADAAAASERKAIEAAKAAYTNAVNAARKQSADARSKVFSLERERDNAARHLRATADPRIDEFKAAVWQRFQSRRGTVQCVSEERPSGKWKGVTGQPVYHVWTNGDVLNRWVGVVVSAINRADALKLLPLDSAEVAARLAALQAEVDSAEKATGELSDTGPRGGDKLAEAVMNAKPTIPATKSSRYAVIKEPELVG